MSEPKSIGMLIYCQTTAELQLVLKMKSHGFLPYDLVFVRDWLNSPTFQEGCENTELPQCIFPNDVATVDVYNMFIGDHCEKWWQLPLLSPFSTTLFIEASQFSYITTDLINQVASNSQHVFTSTPHTQLEQFTASHLTQSNPLVMMFDNSQQSWEFFECIRQITTNWDLFAVARLHPKYREKNIQAIISIAMELMYGENPLYMSPAMDVAGIRVLPNTLLLHNNLIKPTTLHHALLRNY